MYIISTIDFLISTIIDIFYYTLQNKLLILEELNLFYATIHPPPTVRDALFVDVTGVSTAPSIIKKIKNLFYATIYSLVLLNASFRP